MAIISSTNLALIRQRVAPDTTVNFTKTDINNAIQAIDDWYEANRVPVSSLINTATSPFVFTVAQKKLIAKYWCQFKFGQGG